MDMQVRLTQFSHGGGCGCKIAPGVLEKILAKSAPGLLPKQLLVGIETADDAAVYQINDTQAIVATTDFFMPIVDDPFDFGAIAATNAISDVYAMGGQPLFALALVAMPVDKLPMEMIRRILEGGESVCAPAGTTMVAACSRHSDRPARDAKLRRSIARPSAPRKPRPTAAPPDCSSQRAFSENVIRSPARTGKAAVTQKPRRFPSFASTRSTFPRAPPSSSTVKSGASPPAT